MNSVIGPMLGFSGKVLSWEVVNSDGSIANACYTPSSNLILDSGLNLIATTDFFINNIMYMAIGTGVALPTVSDTTLGSESARNRCDSGTGYGYAWTYGTYNSITYSAPGSDPYTITIQRGVQTSIAALNGVYTELGFSPSATANGTLFSKFRICDIDGIPTSISVNSSQQLRLKYQLICTITPSAVSSGSFTLAGIGTKDYTSTWAAFGVATPVLDLTGTQQSNQCYSLPPNFCGSTTNMKSLVLYSGVMTTLPTIGAYGSGTALYTSAGERAIGDVGGSIDAYVPGSYQRYLNFVYQVADCNATINGIGLKSGYNGYTLWVAKFDSSITKDNNHKLSFKIGISWGRSV